MQTTTGGTQVYRRAGRVHFLIDGRDAEITLYEYVDQEDLFVPFRDATSGKETYGAGRYEWSCPIPPGENWLTGRPPIVSDA